MAPACYAEANANQENATIELTIVIAAMKGKNARL